MNFSKLHQEDRPLLICNVWDVASAQLAQALHFKAIATSSGAIATMLGYPDGEAMSFPELEYLVGRIRATVDLPLSVDLEAGYSRNPAEVVEHIQRLRALGVVGINLEDSLVNNEKNGERTLQRPTSFASFLTEIANSIKTPNANFFLNIRTDTFLLSVENPIGETIQRANLYQKAGADGLFVPGLVKATAIRNILSEIELPLNVMCMPDLPNFSTLEELGVKRISMGNFVFNYCYQQMKKDLANIQAAESFENLFSATV